jgi:hypothetical protein
MTQVKKAVMNFIGLFAHSFASVYSNEIGSNCGLGQPYNRFYNDPRGLMTALLFNFPLS